MPRCADKETPLLESTRTSNLTFTQGNAPGTTEPHEGNGGAIFDMGSLTLNSDNFNNNIAESGGGAVFNEPLVGTNGSVVVNGPNSQFTSNHAGSYGGALEVAANFASNSLVLNKVAFTSNTVGQAGGTNESGGAVVAAGGTTFQITASNFTNNSLKGSGDGGAIYTTDQLSFVYNSLGDQSTFNTNSATNGGAIAYEPVQNNASSMKVVNVTFVGNTAVNGGAVYCNINTNTGQVNMTITGSLFNTNQATITSATNYGGGLYVNSTTSGSGSSSVAITNSTFFQNSANDYGGGIALSLNNTGTGSNTAVLTSLTVYENSSFNQGGGMWISLTGGGSSTASVTLHNNIVAGNNIENPPSDGPDVFFTNNGGNPDLLQFLADSAHGGGYNLIGVTATGDGTSWDSSDITGTPSNPSNPYLASGLANNGGPTQTIAALQPPQGIRAAWHNGDPTLLNAQSPNNLDQRGFKRTTYVTIGAEDPDAVSS